MNNQEEMQKKFYEYQMLQQELQNIGEIFQNLEKRKKDYELIISSLRGIGEQKKDVLLPLSSGIFIKADVKEDAVFVNVGSGIVTKKSVDEGIKYVTEQYDDLTRTQETLASDVMSIEAKAHQLEHEIAELQQAQTKPKK